MDSRLTAPFIETVFAGKIGFITPVTTPAPQSSVQSVSRRMAVGRFALKNYTNDPDQNICRRG